MRTSLFAAVAALLMTTQTQAFCYSVVEDSAWEGAQQKTVHTLCLQRELAQTTSDRADEVRWKAQLDALNARTDLMLQQQRAAAMLRN